MTAELHRGYLVETGSRHVVATVFMDGRAIGCASREVLDQLTRSAKPGPWREVDPEPCDVCGGEGEIEHGALGWIRCADCHHGERCALCPDPIGIEDCVEREGALYHLACALSNEREQSRVLHPIGSEGCTAPELSAGHDHARKAVLMSQRVSGPERRTYVSMHVGCDDDQSALLDQVESCVMNYRKQGPGRFRVVIERTEGSR